MKKEENKIFIDEFCEKVGKKAGVEDNEAKKFIHTLFDLIGGELEKEEKVQIYQFGIFKKKWTPEKPGINPQTKEKITIPAHNKVSFTPSTLLANEVNRKYRHLRPNVIDEILTLTGIRKVSPEVTKILERDNVMVEEHGVAKKRAIITLIASGIILLMLLTAIILIPVIYSNVEDNNAVNFVKNVNRMLGLNSISEKLSGNKNEEINEAMVSEFLQDSKKDLLQNRAIIATHTVEIGDSIFSIAKSYWENEYLWPDLYIMNQSEFSDPDLIHPGDTITVYEKLGEPEKFSKKQKDQIVQAYIGIYRIYRALGEKDIEDGKASNNKNKIQFGENRVNDSRWTLYTAIRYDHNLLKKYKDAIYPEDSEILVKYIEKFGYQGKSDK